jgi:hypothetical protein
MRFQRILFTILAVAAAFTARAQSEVDLTVRNQHTNGDTLFFDIYLQLTSGPVIYLENSDFILDYDEANFVNPEFGFVDGTTYLLNSNGARTTSYNYNIYTRFGEALNAGKLMVVVALPAFSNQTEFDDRIAKIDTQSATHRLGRFYLTGMQNLSINPNLAWTSGQTDGGNTQIFSLDPVTWNGTGQSIQPEDPNPITAPTINSSNITFSSVTSSSMTLNIGTTGNGARRLILARASSAVGANNPSDGLMYTANTVFGSGSQIGSTGVYAVYDGTGNSVTVTGLSGNTTYYFEVYEYNGSNGQTENYLIPGFEANQQTPYAEPTVNSSSITFSSVTSSSMTLNIGATGNGTSRLILARASSSIGSNHPSDATTYTASATFGSGTQIGTSGVYVVYNGTGNSVTVTGLSSSTTYYFEVYEYNGTAGLENYLIPGVENSQATSAGYITANIKVFLGGPLSGTTMTTTLNSSGLIPLTQPYTNVSPFFYTGTESVISIPNANVVDWVLVELRTGTASNTKVASKACFLLKTGAIVGTDGVSAPQFTGLSAGNYYVVIRHRNHLPVMTATSIALSSSSSLYDFTTAQAKAYGTTPMQTVGSVFAMWAGDANSNGNIRYNGISADRSTVLSAVNATSLSTPVSNVYSNADVNMNGNIRYNGISADRTVILNNVTATSLSTPRTSQVP